MVVTFTFFGGTKLAETECYNATVEILMCYCLFCDTVWFLLFSLSIKPCSVTILCKATEHYFHMVLFLFCDSAVVVTFIPPSVDRNLRKLNATMLL